MTIDGYLTELGWSARELANQLGAHPNTINDWRLGRRPLPPVVEEWLAALAAAHDAHPPPDWKAKGRVARP